MTRTATITTYIGSKKQDIIANNDNFSFNVLPFYFEWNGKKAEINRIEIINDGVRHNNERSMGKNYQKYQQFAPNETQTESWSSGQVNISFSEPVAKAEIKGQTLIIDGDHWVDMWRGIYFDSFELTEIDEDWRKWEDNKLRLKIKEIKIINNNDFFAPTINELLINFGSTGAGMSEYAAKLQVGKKYCFNSGNLENTKILVDRNGNKKLDINNSVNDISKIRLFNEEGEIITHDHPHNDTSQIKEKLLRNLDKISLDPIGYLGNAEVVKSSDIENHLYTNTPEWNKLQEKLYKVEIEGEKIDLRKVKWEDLRAVKNALISEIKQNPQEWKIENSNIYRYNGTPNLTPDTFKVLRHKSGRRHWNVGIIYGTGNLEKGNQDWTEIEALINGSIVSEFNNHENQNNQISNTEKEQIRQYFLKNDIKEIRFENGELIITNNNNNNNNETRNLQQIFQDSKLLEIMSFCQRNNGNKITKEGLNIDSDNTSTSPNSPKSNNRQLVIGLTVGAGAVILVGVAVYSIWKRKKKNNE